MRERERARQRVSLNIERERERGREGARQRESYLTAERVGESVRAFLTAERVGVRRRWCARLGGGAAGRAQPRRRREREKRRRSTAEGVERARLSYRGRREVFFLNGRRELVTQVRQRERSGGGGGQGGARRRWQREREVFFSVWSGGFEMRKTKCRRFCFIEKPNFQVRLVAPDN